MIETRSAADRRGKRVSSLKDSGCRVSCAESKSRQPIFPSPGMARKDWLTSHEASPLSFCRTLNDNEITSGQQEALVFLTVSDPRCCGWLLWGARAESQGAAWPARLGEEKGLGRRKASLGTKIQQGQGWGKGLEQKQGNGMWGRRLSTESLPPFFLPPSH